MQITRLKMEQFRSYTSVDIPFKEGITVLYGANAQGKTNLLEGVFLCCAGKSHRASSDKEMIRYNQPFARVQADILRKDGPHQIQIVLPQQKMKSVRFDGAPVRRLSSFVGQLHCVLFSPENIRMVREGPALRRQFMDLALCQVYPSYVSSLLDYNRALKQRNALLKTGDRIALETLPIWDEQLNQSGTMIMNMRRAFISEVAFYSKIAQFSTD